jgi:hypothetical protein
VSWDRPFDQPVPLPKGAPAPTLRDAAAFIRKLPKAEQEAREWQTAIQTLIDAAENRARTMFAKMALHEAVDRNVARVFERHHRAPVPPLTEWGSATQMRRRFKQTVPLNQRLTEEAQRLRKEAQGTRPGIDRERLIRRARQAETASHIDEWLSSPGLQPPT